MIVVYPDSNVLEPHNRFLESADAVRVVANLAPGLAELWLSPIVHKELERHQARASEAGFRALNKAVADLERALAVSQGTYLKSLQHGLQEMAIDAGYTFEQTWSRAGIGPGPYFEVDIDALVERDFNAQRPFTLKNGQTIGLRDTVIWLGALRTLNDKRVEKVLFVTRDKAFLDEADALHPDLLEDLKEQGIEPGRLELCGNLGEAADWIIQNSTNVTPRERAIRRALYDVDDLLSAFGDSLPDVRRVMAPYEATTRPVFLGSEYLDVVSIGTGTEPTCTYLARFSFEALTTSYYVGIGEPDPEAIPTVPIEFWHEGEVTVHVAYDPIRNEATAIEVLKIEWVDDSNSPPKTPPSASASDRSDRR